MEEEVYRGNNDDSKELKFCFDDNIDLFYGLNYCINRKNQTPKVYNTKEQTPIIQGFYKLDKLPGRRIRRLLLSKP